MRLALPAILAAYLGLAVLYNAATPIFEASDEFRHFLALHSIVQTHQLPVLAPSNDPLSPGVEAGQPPLYYLVAGTISSRVDIGALPGVDFNPHVQEGIPSTDPDNKNLFVHSPVEGFPYRGLSLAVHLERLLSVLLGAGTVWMTYRLAEAVAPGLGAAAPLAASLVAFNPEFLFISTSVDNDNLITFASTAALLVMVRMLRDGVAARRLWLLSGLLGVAMLSKLSGLALPVVAAAAVWVVAFETRQWGIALRRLLVLALGPVVIAGWWYARNWLMYGDPTGLSAWVRIYGGERGGSLTGLLHEVPGLFISYWGVLGGFDIKADDWLYALYLALTAVGIAALGLARRRIGKALGSWVPVWLLLLWFGLELVALVRWTSITTASTGRLLFPAIASLATLVAIGLAGMLPNAFQRPAASAAGIGLAVLAAFVPVRYLMPAYAAPEIARAAAAIGAPAHSLDITYGDAFELLGYDLKPERAKPGEDAELDLYWHVLATPDRNYSVSAQLLSGEGSLGQYDSLPGEGRIATRTLTAGDYFRDRYQVRVNPSAPTPIIGRVMVAMYDEQMATLPAYSRSGVTVSQPILAELAIDPLLPAPAEPDGLARFGDRIELVGDRMPDQPAAPGGTIDVSLQWRATQRVNQDYTVFVHLLDNTGKLVTQKDQQPRNGQFPTSWWAPGETVDDRVSLTIPPGTPPGRYQLVLGVYELGSLQRLSLATGGDTFALATIEVG